MPRLSKKYFEEIIHFIMNYVIYASFSHWSIDFNNLKIGTKSNFGNKLVPDQKVGIQNPLIVWVFKRLNIRI